MQCENMQGMADAMGERSSDESLPAAIQDAVTAAIEDGAAMDEIVARVRSRGGDRSPLIPRARRCARARPAEGRWAEPMQGLICLQRETDRFAEEWVRTRDPRAEGLSALIAIETLRTLTLRTMAELGAHEEPVAAEELGRLALALYRIESADRLRIEREQAAADAAAAHDGPAARAASMTHAERVENRPPGSCGARLPWAYRAATAGIGMGRRLCRGLSRHPAEAGARSAYRRPSREFTCHPAGAGARFACRRRGARFMGRAQGAGCRTETAGGGRPTLADRPSLLPRGMERARVRRMIPHPPQPDTRCRRHDHAMWSDRKDTPTSPRPSPPPRGGEGE